MSVRTRAHTLLPQRIPRVAQTMNVACLQLVGNNPIYGEGILDYALCSQLGVFFFFSRGILTEISCNNVHGNFVVCMCLFVVEKIL